MNRSEIESHIVELMAQRLNVDRTILERGMCLGDAGMDSMQLVEAIFVIEEKYNISISYNANEQAAEAAGASFQTVGDLLDRVVDLIIAKDSEVQKYDAVTTPMNHDAELSEKAITTSDISRNEIFVSFASP